MGNWFAEVIEMLQSRDPVKRNAGFKRDYKWEHDWANWCAVDHDGAMYEFETKPTPVRHNGRWGCICGKFRKVGSIGYYVPHVPHWQEFIIERK